VIFILNLHGQRMVSDSVRSSTGLEITPTEILSRKSVSPCQRWSYIEALPEVVFRVVLDYSEEKDYRNLVNTNLSFFQPIKAATVKYSLFLPKEWSQKMDSDLSQIIKGVEKKSRQISISCKDLQQSAFLKFAHLLEGIHECHFLMQTTQVVLNRASRGSFHLKSLTISII
jgi:hypothetical protein